MDFENENKKLEAGLNEWIRRHDGKRQAIEMELKLEHEQMRYENALVNVSQYIDEDRPENSAPIIVPAKEIGLSWYQGRALALYGMPSLEIMRWLSSHKQEDRNGKPIKYKHVHAIDDLLTDNELAIWNKADGWQWSFAYARAWNSYGNEVEPLINEGRLRVNGKTLYWWLMLEWLARTDKRKAVGLLRGKYEVHHLLPRLLDQREGNGLAALQLVPKSEHQLLTSAQQKINQWYRSKYLLK